ncbi:MAG: arsenic efflux protein [Clostridia bacterium]|nr:arsenic efflux protein [Clostridia bacterium]
MLDVLLDTLLDTAKLIPFLFLTYLFMEFLEHKSGDAAARWLKRSGKVGPLVGAGLGILPQCGFSAAASGLYTGRVITTGTLVAVYLSTSDEMLPILISSGANWKLVLGILGAKFAIGMLAGFLVDLISRLFRKQEEVPDIEDFCEREHCNCKDHFAISALKHTGKITLFLLIFLFLFNTGVFLIGEENIKHFASAQPVLGSLIATLLGLIPNCAPSVLLTELYLSGALKLGDLLAGLLVNAGVGLALLFRNNRPVKDSFRILAILVGIGFSVGLLVDLII